MGIGGREDLNDCKHITPWIGSPVAERLCRLTMKRCKRKTVCGQLRMMQLEKEAER